MLDFLFPWLLPLSSIMYYVLGMVISDAVSPSTWMKALRARVFVLQTNLLSQVLRMVLSTFLVFNAYFQVNSLWFLIKISKFKNICLSKVLWLMYLPISDQTWKKGNCFFFCFWVSVRGWPFVELSSPTIYHPLAFRAEYSWGFFLEHVVPHGSKFRGSS